jgi:hypothetical protein
MFNLLKIFKDFNDFQAFRNYKKDYTTNPYNIDYFYATENIDNYVITVKAEGIRKDDIMLEFIKSRSEKKVVVTFKQTDHIIIKRTEIYIVGLDANLNDSQAHLCNSNLVIVIPKLAQELLPTSIKMEDFGNLEEV